MRRVHISEPFLKFLATGGTCFIINILVLYAATDLLGLHYLFSMLLSIATVNLFGWALNRHHTFKTKDTNALPEFIRYLVINLVSMSISLLVMYLLVSIFDLHYLFASTAIAMCMTVINFHAHSQWSFQAKSN